MQLNQIKSKQPRPTKKRIGRGGKKGTYSGRGVKGQKSRSGANFEPSIRPFIKRYPKRKGIGFRHSRPETVALQLEEVAKKFSAGEIINPQALEEKGLLSFPSGKKVEVKILSSGQLKKELIFESCQFSKAARGKVEKAGGRIKKEKVKSNKIKRLKD